MKIVTGYKGTPHISSNDDQGRNQGTFGTGNFVLDVGNKFSATLTDATTVSIQDGEGSLHGVHFRTLPGTVDTVNIQNGTQGYNRIDLICARYSKEAVTGIESVEWVVIPGTPSASTPTAPDYNDGDVLTGDTPVDFPMYSVTLTGLTPSLTRLFEVSVSRPTAQTLYASQASTSIAAGGSISTPSITLEPGMWLIYVRASVHFLSGSIADGDYVDVQGPFVLKQELFQGQYDCDLIGMFPMDVAETDVITYTVRNQTQRAGTLVGFDVIGVRL